MLGDWIHNLVFDLFVGALNVRDAPRQDINHWLTTPMLFATRMADPPGLMLYLLLRLAEARKYTLDESIYLG